MRFGLVLGDGLDDRGSRKIIIRIGGFFWAVGFGCRVLVPGVSRSGDVKGSFHLFFGFMINESTTWIL